MKRFTLKNISWFQTPQNGPRLHQVDPVFILSKN
jgi:hypothetical protein